MYTLGGPRVDPLGHPFDAIAMDAFGEGPRRKLVATSEEVRKRSPEKRAALRYPGSVPIRLLLAKPC